MTSDFDTPPHLAADTPALAKAHTMLSMLPAEKREEVLARMDPEKADQLRAMGFASAEAMGPGAMIERKRLMQEFNSRVSERRIAGVDEANVAMPQDIPLESMSAPAPAQGSFTADVQRPATPLSSRKPAALPKKDPLDELKHVHPVALARTMQGERAETWAIVLGRVDHASRAAIMGYLDHDSRVAIEQATRQHEQLSPLARDLAEHAIRTTVVPRALREHHILTIGTPAPAPAQQAFPTTHFAS